MRWEMITVDGASGALVAAAELLSSDVDVVVVPDRCRRVSSGPVAG